MVLKAFRRLRCKVFIVWVVVGMLLWNSFLFAISINPTYASTGGNLTWDWTTDLGAYPTSARAWPSKTNIGPLAVDVNNDGKMEIIVTGGKEDITETINGTGVIGTVTCLNGTDGTVLWQDRTNGSKIWQEDVNGNIRWQRSFKGGIGTHSPFDIVDINKDGIPEIVIAAKYPLVLFGNNGSVCWTREDVLAYGHYPAVADIDGNGYCTLFFTGSDGPYTEQGGLITSLWYNGSIRAQTYSWHPCWGGLTVGDANFDGKFELYQGDRSIYYDDPPDPYKHGGMGVQVVDAKTLQPLWNDADVLVSSHIPILADINNDGFLEIIVGDQGSQGLAVYNYDGTVCTTGGIYRKAQDLGLYSHSQPTVYDVDGDGNLEIITNNNEHNVASMCPKIWDLVQWKLEATLNITSEQPPKVGAVMPDGKMDIIAASNMYNNGSIAPGNQPGTLYIFNSTYQVVDSILNAWANDMTLVQDINGDGKNELVYTSSAAVIAYFTKAPAPSPLPRTNLQFYSERRAGAAEYVPPFSTAATSPYPVVASTYPADQATNVPTSISNLQILLQDYQNDTMNFTASAISPAKFFNTTKGTKVANGTLLSIPVNGPLKPLTKYTWNVSVVDQNGNWMWNKYDTFTFYTQALQPPGHPPTQGTPLLVSSGGTNTTSENLISTNQSTSDQDGNSVTNIYNWYGNNASITALNMPFDTNASYTTVAKDYSGNQNDGAIYQAGTQNTLYLSPVWRNGIVGGAYTFDTNYYIRVADNPGLGDGTWSAITLEFWIKPSDLHTSSTIIAKKIWVGTSTASPSYMVGFQSSAANKLFWGITTNGGMWYVLNDTTLLSPNRWHHVVCTYKSGDGLKIHVNGTLTSSKALSGVIENVTPRPGDEDVYIGGMRSAGSDPSHWLNATLDEVRIYTRALSPQQILQRYSETRYGSSSNSTLVSNETSSFDTWKCAVTPNDGYQDGATKLSNTLTVINPGMSQVASIRITHTYIGDLNVTIGVGSPSAPLWSQLLWNRTGGRGPGYLNLTVDLSAALAYLPPSNASRWFLKVYDAAAGDTGNVTSFTITYNSTTYVSSDVPVAIYDFQTSYAYIPMLPVSPPPSVANIYIQHTYLSDLNITIGVGSPSAPLWSQIVWNRPSGKGPGYLNLTVDLSAALAYLPPSNASRWFLKVYDAAAGDTGNITSFTIAYNGTTYVSPDVPVPIYDFKTSYACVPTSAPHANIFIQHTYIGDLNVTIGVGSSQTPWTAPLWSQLIWNRTGGSTQNLTLTVSLMDAVNHLPPSQNLTWYLQVYDGGKGDQGQIVAFTIMSQGATYTSPDTPVISDFKTSYAIISG